MSTTNVARLVQLCIQILRVNRKFRDSITAIVAQEDLSLEGWLILSTMNENSGLSMSELSNMLGLRISGVSKNVDRLAKRALVYRQQDTYDNRRVLLFISDFGKEMIGRLEMQVESFSIDIQSVVSMQNIELSLDTLDSVNFDNMSRQGYAQAESQ